MAVGLPGFTADSALTSAAIVPMLINTGGGPAQNTKTCCCWDKYNFKLTCGTCSCPRESVMTCQCDTWTDINGKPVSVTPGCKCTHIPVSR